MLIIELLLMFQIWSEFELGAHADPIHVGKYIAQYSVSVKGLFCLLPSPNYDAKKKNNKSFFSSISSFCFIRTIAQLQKSGINLTF